MQYLHPWSGDLVNPVHACDGVGSLPCVHCVHGWHWKELVVPVPSQLLGSMYLPTPQPTSDGVHGEHEWRSTGTVPLHGVDMCWRLAHDPHGVQVDALDVSRLYVPVPSHIPLVVAILTL